MNGGLRGHAREAAASVRRAWRTVRGPRDWIAVALLVIFIVGAALTTGWLTRYGIAINRLTYGVGDLVFYDGNGRAWFRMNEQRKDVPLVRISPYLQRAVIAVEDRRFRYHPGVDPIGLARATLRNVREPGTVEGGSTLTQQLARTLYLSNAKTYGRKIKEAALALLLELRLSKDDILELYLNRVYLSAGVYGVEAMSNNLFGKHAKDLGVGEAALVAGLIQAPSALSPWSNYEGALRRRNTVLARMREAGLHHRRGTERRTPSAPAHQAPPGSAGRPRRIREGVPAAAVPIALRRAISRRTGRCTRRCSPPCRTRPRRRWRTACGDWASRICRPHWSRWTRARATCSRSWADATSGRRRSIAPRAAAASPGPRSSRSSTQPP